MSLFESTLALLSVAVVLLQLARRLRVPYPALLALVIAVRFVDTDSAWVRHIVKG